MFRTSILVRFGDLDPAGIVYYPNMVRFLDEAFEDFFAGHVGRAYAEVFKEGIGFPTVKIDIDYSSPAHYGATLDVDVTVEHVGRSSVRFLYEASSDGKAVFRALHTAVVVQMPEFKPSPIPPWLRERLEAARPNRSSQ